MKSRLRLPGEAWPSRPRTRARYAMVRVFTDSIGGRAQWAVVCPYHRRPIWNGPCVASGIADDRAEAMRQALEWAVANAAVVEFGDRDIRRWARRASR